MGSDILKPDLNDRKEKVENEKAFRHYLAHPQNWNLYVYVLNNPLAIIDPDGRGWKRSVDKDKDGNEVVSYYWMNNPDVHDVPDYYQYVDTKGKMIVLNGVSSNNWHEWGVMNLDGSITPGDQKANMTPAGYENYEMVKGSLMSAGYYMFIDPHPDHMNGVNFMTKDSPTLNVTLKPDGGCIANGCKGVEPFPRQKVKADAHVEKYHPHKQFLKHQIFEVIPNALGRIF